MNQLLIPTGRIERALSSASRVAMTSERDNKFNMVAVIKRSGNIISTGQNSMEKTHPVFFNGKYNKCIHAEYEAIRKVRHNDLVGTDIYVFYFKKSGGLGNSKPCDDCLKIIKQKGISRIYYCENGKLICMSV